MRESNSNEFKGYLLINKMTLSEHERRAGADVYEQGADSIGLC